MTLKTNRPHSTLTAPLATAANRIALNKPTPYANPRPTLCCDAVDCRTHAPPGAKRALASNKKKLIQISHLPRTNGKAAQNNAVL